MEGEVAPSAMGALQALELSNACVIASLSTRYLEMKNRNISILIVKSSNIVWVCVQKKANKLSNNL